MILVKESGVAKFSYAHLPDDLQEYLQRDNIPFNIRGIRSDIERLMICSKKGNNGTPDFSNWKGVLGISKRSVFHSKKPVEFITYSQFKDLPTDFLCDENFPGFREAKNIFEKKLLEEAVTRCGTKKEIAIFLRIAESNIPLKMSKHNISLFNPRGSKEVSTSLTKGEYHGYSKKYHSCHSIFRSCTFILFNCKR